MSTPSQNRPALSRTVQQADATELASIVAYQTEPFTATGTMSGDADLASCDADGGTFTLTLPGQADAILGKPYVVKEYGGTNPVTIDAAGAGTIDGSATFVLAPMESVTLTPREVNAAGLVIWDVLSTTPSAGGDPTAIHVNLAGEITGIAAKATPVDADTLVIEDSAAANAKKSITIGTIPVAQAQVSSALLQPAQDAAVDIDATIGGAQLDSAAGAKAITTSASYPGQKVNLFLLAAAGGSYTLALDAGTLTLDAAGEGAIVMRDSGDTAWVVVGLSGGATIV
jgi:hypothetical protein